MRTMYLDDLAHVHHDGFGEFARRAAPGLLALLREAGIARGGTVVDLGCGSGIWLRELTRAGYSTVGVDASPALLGIARRVAQRAALELASLYDFDLPACDAVTAIGEVLNYCPSGSRGKPSLRALFRRVHSALRPGGLLVFDLMMASRGRPLKYRTWREEESWAVLTDVHEDRRRGRLTRDIVVFRRNGTTYRRSQERHVLSVAHRAEVERCLREAGFSVRASRRYGDLELPPRRLAFRARRR